MNTFTLFLVGLLFYSSSLFSNNTLNLEVSCLDSLVFYTTDTTCTANFEIPKPEATGGCTAEIGYAISGDFMNFSNENVEVGTYFTMIEVFDECGDTVVCDMVIEVKDSIPPLAVCRESITIELQPTPFPQVEFWALDLDDGSYDNCDGNLQYSLDPDMMQPSIIFDCCNLGVNKLELWVTDEFGNQSFCCGNVYVNKFFTSSPCGPTYQFAGIISTEVEATIENVFVQVDGAYGNPYALTGEDGKYWINYENYDTVTITPSLNEFPLNGVTTFDMVLIQKHILDVQPLDSPYKLIAADVNKSETITTLDLLQIRKLILGINQNFSNNNSWRFVDEEYEFPDPENPWLEPYPEVIITDQFSCNFDYGFKGIKIGDVNNTAIPNGG